MSTDKLILRQITALLQQHASEMATLKVKVRKLTRQRDDAVGRAREYRSYVTKYQKELAALRKEARDAL